MDKLSSSDKQLLRALQSDAALSQIDIAEKSGLSRTSVWRRVRELEDSGIIEKRVALVNPAKLGLQIHVLLSVTMVRHSDRVRESFESHVAQLPEVLECFSVSGERDYVLQIISRDMASYNAFLNTKILHHDSVHSASSSFALRRVKYTTELPV